MSLDKAIIILELNIDASKIIEETLNKQVTDEKNMELENALASAKNSVIAMNNALNAIHIAKVSLLITQAAFNKN